MDNFNRIKQKYQRLTNALISAADKYGVPKSWRLSGAVFGGLAVAALLLTITWTGLSQDGVGNTPIKFPNIIGQQTYQNPLGDKRLYVNPDSNASRQAEVWRATMPAAATQMDKLADQPEAKWFSNGANYDEIHNYVAAANDKGEMPLTVAYYIPERDCNKYSSGGAPNEMAYYDYIDTYAKAIGNMQATVILEPDALVHTRSTDNEGNPCLNQKGQDMYFTLLSYAVDRFKSLPATVVYIDAGNSGWTDDTSDIAGRLRRAGIEKADGFALNVSNFYPIDETTKYGSEISDKIDGKHFVIDTSRNGLGKYRNPVHEAYTWCNPPGRALGHYPTVDTGNERVDAFLYIKSIGESDGQDSDPMKCFGGPKAGEWWPEYALGLVERWPAELQYVNRQQ